MGSRVITDQVILFDELWYTVSLVVEINLDSVDSWCRNTYGPAFFTGYPSAFIRAAGITVFRWNGDPTKINFRSEALRDAFILKWAT